MLISIIVTVYNVEKYIYQCLDSLVRIEYLKNDYEIIIVNDGTKDNSMNIVQEFAQLYKNIKIINQENQGLSIARNHGLSIAKGEYIWFVDSDDWVDSKVISRVKEKIVDSPDIIAIGICNVFEITHRQIKESFCNSTLKSNYISGRDFLFKEKRITPAQKYIFKRDFLKANNISFYPNILYEDAEFCMRALYLAKRVLVVPECCYYYLQRISGSITSSYGKRHLDSSMIVFESLSKFEKHIKKSDFLRWRAKKSQIVIMYMLGAIGRSEWNISDPKRFNVEFSKVKRTIKQNLWFGILYPFMNKHSVVMVGLFYLSPKLLFNHIKKKNK